MKIKSKIYFIQLTKFLYKLYPNISKAPFENNNNNIVINIDNEINKNKNLSNLLYVNINNYYNINILNNTNNNGMVETQILSVKKNTSIQVN